VRNRHNWHSHYQLPTRTPTPHVHQWGDWVTTTPATCTVAGVQTRVFALDATHTETQSISIDPNAHQWGDWQVTKAPTTTEAGEETKTCATCGEKEIRAIDKLSELPTTPADTPRTLTFGENTYTVTIKSNDQFTAAEWTALCDKVKTALETAYGAGNNANRTRFQGVFERGVTIVFEKNPTGYTNYKVGADFQTLYLNVDSIETVNYASAIRGMNSNDPTDTHLIGAYDASRKNFHTKTQRYQEHGGDSSCSLCELFRG